MQIPHSVVNWVGVSSTEGGGGGEEEVEGEVFKTSEDATLVPGVANDSSVGKGVAFTGL